MASKPAKRNVTNQATSVAKKNEGEIVLYMGLTKEVMNTCPNCGKKTGKGIVRKYKENLYCSKRCVVMVVELDEGQ